MPPAWGIMAESSPYERAAATVRTAVMSHAPEEPTGTANIACHVGGNDEDSGADHDADDDHDGIEDSQFADEARVVSLGVVSVGIWHVFM
jgi:hypothetical protein